MTQLLLFLLLALALVHVSNSKATTGIEKVSAVEKLRNFFRRSPPPIPEVVPVTEPVLLPHGVSIVSTHPDELRIRNRFSKALEEKKITELQFETVKTYNKSSFRVRWSSYRNLIAKNVAKDVPPVEFRQLLFQQFVKNQPLDSPETFLYLNKAYEMVYNRRTTHPESNTIQKVEISPTLPNDADIEKAYLTAFQKGQISKEEYHLAAKTYKKHLVETLEKDINFIYLDPGNIRRHNFLWDFLEYRLSTQPCVLDSPDFALSADRVVQSQGFTELQENLENRLSTIKKDLAHFEAQG